MTLVREALTLAPRAAALERSTVVIDGECERGRVLAGKSFEQLPSAYQGLGNYYEQIPVGMTGSSPCTISKWLQISGSERVSQKWKWAGGREQLDYEQK